MTQPSSPTPNDKLYQCIGEFVVSFQGLEDLFRQIGWLILDPHRTVWPPTWFRDVTNNELLNQVERLFGDLMNAMNRADAATRKAEFASLVARSHEIRKYRNTLLHSAFIELRAGGEVIGLLRSNPKPKTDPATGDSVFDQEALTEEAIVGKLRELAEVHLSAGRHYIQLIHWAPFGNPPPPTRAEET
jgi:hypothetical protein